MLENKLYRNEKKKKIFFIGIILLYYLLTALVYRSEKSSMVNEANYFQFALLDSLLFTLLTCVSITLYYFFEKRSKKTLLYKVWGLIILALITGIMGHMCETTVLAPYKLKIGFTVTTKPLWYGTIHSVSKISFAFLGCIAYVTIRRLNEIEQLRNKAETDKISAQLQLLKAQTHPHFLFNTLNNIYSFALRKKPETPELLLRLSNLLGYMLYDCADQYIELQKEISILNDYIELEKLRHTNNLNISLSIEGDMANKKIPPMLLFPIIENAFKYVNTQQPNPWVSISMKISPTHLNIKISNPFLNVLKTVQSPTTKSITGFGLMSVRKQMEYLFGENGFFLTTTEENTFIAELSIPHH